jgi:hypothetical protein
MAWVLLDDNFPLHPKAIQAGPVAAYLYVCGLCYCRKHHTGGFIPARALPLLGLNTRPQRMVDALVEAGLWIKSEGGYNVHDYDGFYADEDDKAGKHDLRRKRQEAGRMGGLAKASNTPSKTLASASSKDGMVRSGDLDQQLEERKREADFGAFWDHYPKKDAKKAAREIWMKLKLDDETQRIIRADLERRCQSAQWLKEGGQFIPMARTYLGQKRWEDGFVERPRLSERTINVLKGFEEPHDISGVQDPHRPVGGAVGGGVRPPDVEVVSPSVGGHSPAPVDRGGGRSGEKPDEVPERSAAPGIGGTHPTSVAEGVSLYRLSRV